MNEAVKKETKIDLYNATERKWSTYSFLISLFSFTTVAILIPIIMFMHKKFDGATYANWVMVVVAINLELGFIGLAVLDGLRKNPQERLYGSRILNLPVFSITVLAILAIFWGKPLQISLVYGAICGGFAGYLAGGLAYGNFFVRIKDAIFRTVFGGWIGVSLGAIFGALFTGLMNPLFEEVFAGIFMGFWGGAIVSGPVAVILLVVLEKNIGFRNIFSKILYYDMYRKVKAETKDILTAAAEDDTTIITKHISNHKLLNVQEESKDEEETGWEKTLRIIRNIIFLINPWEKDNEILRVEAYKDIFSLYFTNLYIKSLDKNPAENYSFESDSESKLRQTIIDALECLPVERSKELIIYALKDPNCDVVFTAIKNLGNLKLKEAIPYLQKLIYAETAGCLESKTNKSISNKLVKNIDSSIANILNQKIGKVENLAFKILFTDKDKYESVTELIPDTLDFSSEDLIQLARLLIDNQRASKKMCEVSRDQIAVVISQIAIRLPPEELKVVLIKLREERMSNLAKKIESYEEVFV